jgi:hypothetical protein
LRACDCGRRTIHTMADPRRGQRRLSACRLKANAPT